MESRSPKLNCRLVLLIAQTIFCLLIFIIPILQHNYQKKIATITEGRSEHFQEINNKDKTVLPENRTPICVGNLLDEHREFRYRKNFGRFFENRNRDKRQSCRLPYYTDELVVSCLDALYDSRKLSQNLNMEKKLHFVFMGDSRIRQQFYNFLRLIPDHDRMSNPSPIPPIYHDDIEVTSEILRLRVSFKWRPFVDDNVTETMRKWEISERNRKPDLILFGMVLWHIVRIHSLKDYLVYHTSLTELGSILNHLANSSNIIWLNQYPTAEFYGGMPYGGENDSDVIVSEKLHSYNKAIRRIFEDCCRSVRVWDSSNQVVEEYVRACAVIPRGPSPLNLPDHSYIECSDYIHTGYSALSQATQLLYNEICNTILLTNT